MSNCNDIVPCNQCNDCPTCGCCQEECTCTTPGYDPTGCVETTESDCVVFNGENLPCIPIQKNNKLTVVIQRIAAYLKNLFNHVHSDSLVVTPSAGACNSDLQIEIQPSADPNNIFVLGTDNYPYVPAPIYPAMDMNIISGDCIVWTKTIVGNVITFTYTIDWNCMASHVCAANCGDVCPNPLDLSVN